MEGTTTSTTAVLVRPEDTGGRPQAATVSVAREEIEEALASDDAPELILEVRLRETERRELHVAWQRSDLESVLAGAGPGRIAFSFEPSELSRALEHPDFEGHGFREAILLTVAAASASAAVAVSTVQAGIAEGTGVGGVAPAAAVSPGHAEAGTAAALATAAATKDEAAHDEATLVERGVEPAPVTVDSGSALELPSVDAGTAAVIGGLAGAGLLIVGGTFATRRRTGTA